MKREAFKMFLKPGCEAEYERRHAQIWPELKQLLSENGVYDYSIYWDKDTLSEDQRRSFIPRNGKYSYCTKMVGLYG